MHASHIQLYRIAYAHSHTYEWFCARMNSYIRTHMHTHTYTRTRTKECDRRAKNSAWRFYTPTFIQISVCIHIHLCKFAHVHTHLYTNLYAHTHTYKNIRMSSTRAECATFLAWPFYTPIFLNFYMYMCMIFPNVYIFINHFFTRAHTYKRVRSREVGGWGRDPKKCTGSIWGMGSSTI